MDEKEKYFGIIKTQLYDVVGDNINAVMQIIEDSLLSYDLQLKPTSIVRYDDTDDFLLKKFFVGKAAQGLSDKTLTTYRTVLSLFFRNVNKHIKDVSTDDVRVFLTYARIRGKSANWANLVRRTLNSFYSYLIDEGDAVCNPARKIKKINGAKKVENALDDEQMELLRAKAKRLRDRAIIEFLFSTGCRVSEMTQLNRDDIDFENGVVVVLGKGGKYRRVFLSARCKIVLQQYLKERKDDNEALFVSSADDQRIIAIMKNRGIQRLGNSGVESMVRNLGKKAGIEGVHPHLFRKSVATAALKRGMGITDVQRILGHSSINTTMIYAQVNDDDVRREHEKFII